MSENRKKFHVFLRLTTLFFLLFILVFSLGKFLKKDRSFSVAENRTLAEKPVITWNRVLSGDFEKDLESYLNDQFLGRDFFVAMKTKIDVSLGKRESQGVVLGKNGQLMEKFQPCSKQDADKKTKAIQKFLQKNKKVNSYFLIAPTAVSVYKEDLPKGIPVVDQNRYMDTFFKQISKLGGKPLDVRSALEQNKEKQVYYKTDHHWTSFGAYTSFLSAGKKMGLKVDKVSYEAKSVTNDFQGSLTYKSGFDMDERDSIEVYFPKRGGVDSVVDYVEEKQKTATLYNHKKLATRDGYGMFLDGNHSEIKIQSPVKKNNKVLLILKDSYANSFIPFLTSSYSEIVVVDPRYYYDDVQELIKSEKVTDVLFLYNANTFFSDTALTNVLG